MRVGFRETCKLDDGTHKQSNQNISVENNMIHTPTVIATDIGYFRFKLHMDSPGGPEHTPDIDKKNAAYRDFEPQRYKNYIAGWDIQSVTPIQKGSLDFMGDQMSVGGMSPTDGIFVHWVMTCCSLRRSRDNGDRSKWDANDYLSWAICHRNCNNLQYAWQIMLVALKKFPSNASILYDLACHGALLGKSDSARKYLEEAIEIEPSRKAAASDDPDLVLLF